MNFWNGVRGAVRCGSLVIGCISALWGAEIRVIGGTGARGFSGDGGLAVNAQFNEVSGIARGPDGALYLCDTGNDRIRRIGRDGIVTTVAGTGVKGYAGDGGPAAKAQLNEPWEIKFDREGNAFWVERGNAVVREKEKISGVIRTVAGTGHPGFSGDGGKAALAQLGEPHSLAFGPDGALYVCDLRNERVRKIDLHSGIIVTVAGTGGKGSTPDGAKIAGTPLNGPRAIEFDANGLMWLVLRDGNAVVTLDLAKGTIRRAAGSGKKGLSGDEVPPAAATFNGPKGLSVAGGKVYIADTENHCIRRLDPATGKLIRAAGTGKKGDGPFADPLAAGLNRPHGVLAIDDGSFWIGDTDGNRVLYVAQEATASKAPALK
jgi:streptogramin lyase